MWNQYYYYFHLSNLGSVGPVQQKTKLPSPYYNVLALSCMILYHLQHLKHFNPFHANDLFWYSLKTSENLWFSDVFRGHQKRSVAWNGLNILNYNWNTCSSNENLFQYRATRSTIKTNGSLRKCNILTSHLRYYPCSISDISRQSNFNKKFF